MFDRIEYKRRGEKTSINMHSDNLEKFPQFMKKHFHDNNITFPEATRWSYNPISAYRAIKYEEGKTEISEEDFRSKAEETLNKSIRGRGAAEPAWNNPAFYGVSLFENKEKLVNLFKLPRPSKRLAHGLVVSEVGPIYIKEEHITWWLYDGSFELIRNTFKIE